MNQKEKVADLTTEALKASPAVAVQVISGTYTLQDWVWIATLFYLGLQGAWLLWRWWKAAHTPGWKPSE